MMPEISLNILDVAQNSITVGSLLTEISISADRKEDTLEVVIKDNGRGMAPEQLEKVTDPFFTTRTTRRVGVGVPFLKMAAELTGGSFHIESTLGVGTKVSATFGLSHIDRMPMGDIAATITALVGPNPDIDFLFSYSINENSFVMDTREIRKELDGVSLAEPEVLQFITGFINENIGEIGGVL